MFDKKNPFVSTKYYSLPLIRLCRFLSKALVAVSKPLTELLKLLVFFHATSSQAASEGFPRQPTAPRVELSEFSRTVAFSWDSDTRTCIARSPLP